jgi:hypothetical protein
MVALKVRGFRSAGRQAVSPLAKFHMNARTLAELALKL